MQRLDYLIQQGITASLQDDLIIIEPKHLINEQIKLYVKAFKIELKKELLVHSQNVRKLPQLTELTIQQQLWLNQIANILNVTPDYLLHHRLIDQFDLEELLEKPPVIVANTIKAGYYWIKINNTVG